MKKLLSTLLCLCMLFSILTVNVSAATQVNVFNITIEEPAVGKLPATTASVPSHASTFVTGVKWDGNFNSDGTFMDNNKYTVDITVNILPDLDKIIKFVEGKAKINGNIAKEVSTSSDKKSITLRYTFKVSSDSSVDTGSTSTTTKYDRLSLNEYEWEVIRLCNIERAKENLPAFSTIGTLQNCCDIREKELPELFSHSRPDNSDFSTVIPDYFEWELLSENIASGQPTPEVVVDAWMNSPGHRANILNPEHIYMGVGFNSKGNYWVQLFSSSKKISKVTTNADTTELTEDEITNYYLELVAANNYVSYMPADFASMKKIGDTYSPRISSASLPSFTKVEKTANTVPQQQTPSEPSTITVGPIINTNIEAGGIFERYIPIAQVYAADLSVPYNLKPGQNFHFDIGTRFPNSNTKDSPMFAERIKRNEYLNHYIKLNYLGTYGTVGADIADSKLSLFDTSEYKKVMNGEESSWAKAYNITKDTLVISIDMYDADKNFVRTLNPASVIVATANDGSFLTFSKYLEYSTTFYFSPLDNYFNADDDITSWNKKIAFDVKDTTLSNVAATENLLTATEFEKYEYIQYPALSGTPQYNTNLILSEEEFISGDMTYYQVATEYGKPDPIIKNEVRDVVSYSYYTHRLGVGSSQRNLLSADGTLYGVNTSYNKKVIAKNVKKTTANHYLTNDGEVKELNGKVIATDCIDLEESNNGWVVGVIKSDGSFHMGYSYVEGKDGYERGLSKMLDNAKFLVPNAVITNDNTLYRWHQDIIRSEIDMNAFYSGKVVQETTLKLSIVEVCRDVERIFPYELLSKITANSEEWANHTIYGFAQRSDGKLFGYSLTYHQGFGTFGKIERIFPMFTSHNAGNFVGIKVENEGIPYGICSRYCDNNVYRWGKFTNAADFVSETLGGFLAADGVVYSIDEHPSDSGAKNEVILCISNANTNLPQMHKASATYNAYNREKNTNIHLLPSISNWWNDSSRITLLERTDGSMWMASIFTPASNANLIAQTDGYESSNVFQVSKPTTNKVNTKYLDVNEVRLPESTKLQFEDVSPDAWYANPVQWAIDIGITSGTSPTTFSPALTCTKAQILTFLWRAVGSPEMTGENPFSDVKTTDYYYAAALWANSKGLATGNTFDGTSPCTRAATVVYLWKYAGSPQASYNGKFSDVSSDSDYASAVSWAVNNNITSGMSDTSFSPDTTCTRGQIVTFLQRALK